MRTASGWLLRITARLVAMTLILVPVWMICVALMVVRLRLRPLSLTKTCWV